MGLPAAFVGGALVGAAAGAAHLLLKEPPTKEELARKKLEGDTLFVVQPKTLLQRAATNVVNSLFF